MAGDDREDPVLARFRQMSRPARLIYARRRSFIALGVGILVCLLLPGSLRLATRLVIGWDAMIAVYLALVYGMMLNHDHRHIRRAAAIQDDGRFVILTVIAVGAFASIAALVSVLGTSHRSVADLAIAIVTIALSWAAVHTTFALHYAHDYYGRAKPGGLQFPCEDNEERADYWDFVYFSFVIGMTAQVSDVGITDKTIRRTVTAHGIVSFIYNTALLALTINIVASAISP